MKLSVERFRFLQLNPVSSLELYQVETSRRILLHLGHGVIIHTYVVFPCDCKERGFLDKLIFFWYVCQSSQIKSDNAMSSNEMDIVSHLP